jgi:HEAT repeat protein
MKQTRGWMVLCALVLAAPSVALAHGGQYSGPVTGNPNGGGPQVPPGTSDPPAPSTRWETWWAANKEFFLRLGEQMREDAGPTSRGLTGEKAAAGKETEKELRERRDAEARAALVPIFIEALQDESFEVRTAAAVALGKTVSALPESSKALREASNKDKHKDVRDSSILGLGLLGRPSDIPFLEARLNDPKENTRHRSFAAFGLGLIGGEDAATALLNFTDGRPDKPSTFFHEQPPLISSTYVAMGLTGDARVLPTLHDALNNPRLDDQVRAFVVLSLGRIKDRESIPDLIKMMGSEKDDRMVGGDKDAGIRRSAAIALGKIARIEDKQIVDTLLGATRCDQDEMVRHFSAISLGGVADAAVRLRLRKLFEEAGPQAKPFMAISMALSKDVDAAPILRAALAKETDAGPSGESIKSCYCVALALLKDREASPLIVKQLEERNRIWLNGYAALALGILRHVESADMLATRLAAESDPRLRANLAVGLGLMHDPRAKQVLVDTLKKKDATVYERGGAAMGMGVLRLTEAYTDIVEVYRDKKEMDLVRAFAVVALGHIADPSAVPKLSKFAIDNNYSLSVDPLNEVLSIL